MVDSIAVFDPGTRITDSTGAPVSDARIAFYDAGTSNAMTVYSDAALSNALGPIVYCDADGAPVSASGGNTKVGVYVGTAAYKVVISRANGAVIETKDNVAGALNTTPFEAGQEALPIHPVISKSVDYTIVVGDQAKIIDVDCTAGDITITLPDAVAVGDNWSVTVRHVGAANSLVIASVSGQTVSIPLPGGAKQSFEMVAYGESLTFVSNGANWVVPASAIGLKLGSGYHSTLYDIGTLDGDGGPYRVEPENGNFQKLLHDGAFALYPPRKTSNVVILVTNGANAGGVSTGQFTKVSGDAITTSVGNKFFFHVTATYEDDSNWYSRLFVEALQ